MNINIKNQSIVASMSLDEAKVILNLLGEQSTDSYEERFEKLTKGTNILNMYKEFQLTIEQATSLYGAITPKVGHHYIDVNKEHIVILGGHFVTSGLSDKKNFFTYGVIREDSIIQTGYIDQDFMVWFKSLTPHPAFKVQS